MGLFDKRKITRVKCLGIRTAENTGIFATYNSAVYAIVIEYDDGTRELEEISGKQMVKYLQYIDMDK